MKEHFKNKDILVTGGCGSIGSQIVSELLNCDVKRVRSFDNNENGQFNLSRKFGKSTKLRLLMGDVRDQERLSWAMDGVDIVFHAAALKHVPLCEYNPSEAVKTNVQGALNIINTARDKNVEKAVLISTDKAVNPISAMGASKLMAEKLFIDADAGVMGTKYSCVRFGNVFGSNGSVFPVFKDQIASGGPVTVTSREMSRFSMSIKDAVDLVLSVTTFMEGREIYILKMKSLMIYDLAEAMIEVYAPLHNYSSGDIKIEIIGPRAGEKMYEQLLSEEELHHTTEEDRYFVYRPPIIAPHIEERLHPAKPISIEHYNSAAAPKLNKEQLITFIKEVMSLLGVVGDRLGQLA